MPLPTLMPSPRQRFVDNLGLPLVNGMVFTFAAGTSDKLAAFTDAAGLVPHENPIRLDERGEATIYWLGNYRVNLRSAIGIQIPGYPVDNFNTDPLTLSNILPQLAASNGAALIGGVNQVVGSIAALRALLKSSASKNAIATGYYAAGDGGGGQYRYDPADTSSADNGGTVIVASDGGRWKLVLTGNTVTVKHFGAKGDFNRTTGTGTDDKAAFQTASDWCAANCFKLFVPQHAALGGYLIRSTWDLTSTMTISRQGLEIEFENRSTEFQRGTLLCGETGSTPVVDTSGSDGIYTKNLGIVPGFANKSTIGVLQGRTAGTGSTGWAGDQSHQDAYIDLKSNTSANGGFGTIGWINIAGEETKYTNLQIWANTPFCSSTSAVMQATASNMGDGYRNFTAVSPFVGLTTAGSNTVIVFSGFSRLIAYDYVSACAFIQEAGTIDLGSTFMQKRLSGSAGVTIGVHVHAIEAWGIAQLKHYGSVEGCRAYLLNRRYLSSADLSARFGETNVAHTNPLIMLWGDGGSYPFSGVSIKIDAPGSLAPTLTRILGWRRNSGTGGNEPAPFTIDKVVIHNTLPWVNTMIDAGMLRSCKSGEFSFSDRQLSYTGGGCFNTTIETNIGNNSSAAVAVARLQFPAAIAGVSTLGLSARFDGVATNATLSGVGSASAAQVSMQMSAAQDPNGVVAASLPSNSMLNTSSVSTAGNSITGVTFTLSVDAGTNLMTILAHPVQTGANNADVLLKGKFEVFTTQGYKNDVQFIAV